MARQISGPDTAGLFLWGYVKDRVYETETTTPAVLKRKIADACHAIPPEVLRNSTQAVIKRAQMCVAAEGDLFEHCL